MRVLIISDTHKCQKNLEYIMERMEPIDLLIHLGDTEGYEDEIAQIAECPVEMVAGNNDYFSELDREKELRLGKYRVLLTHGHYYYVSMGLANIKREAESRGFDIVMFGHTHRPMVEYDRGLIVVNPGSLSYPRQEGRQPSYIIMEIDRKGEVNFRIEFLSQK